MSEHKSPIPSMIYNAAVGGHVTNSQQIIDENLNREQNDINQETVGTVPYNSTNPNGMGRVVLKKNDNFKEVIEAQIDGNTIFVIKYDFILTNTVTIPANCVLQFEGGSINGAYTLTGTNTGINAGLVKIFNTDIILAGTWNVAEAYPEWFGAINDDWTLAINKTLAYFTIIVLTKSLYTISDTLHMKYNTTLRGKGSANTHLLYTDIDASLNKRVLEYGKSYNYNGDKGTIEHLSFSANTYLQWKGIISYSSIKLYDVYFWYLRSAIKIVGDYNDRVIIDRCHFYWCIPKSTDTEYVIDLSPTVGDCYTITNNHLVAFNLKLDDGVDYYGMRLKNLSATNVYSNIINAPIIAENCEGLNIQGLHQEYKGGVDGNLPSITLERVIGSISNVFTYACTKTNIRVITGSAFGKTSIELSNIGFMYDSERIKELTSINQINKDKGSILKIRNCFLKNLMFTTSQYMCTGIRIQDNNDFNNLSYIASIESTIGLNNEVILPNFVNTVGSGANCYFSDRNSQVPCVNDEYSTRMRYCTLAIADFQRKLSLGNPQGKTIDSTTEPYGVLLGFTSLGDTPFNMLICKKSESDYNKNTNFNKYTIVPCSTKMTNLHDNGASVNSFEYIETEEEFSIDSFTIITRYYYTNGGKNIVLYYNKPITDNGEFVEGDIIINNGTDHKTTKWVYKNGIWIDDNLMPYDAKVKGDTSNRPTNVPASTFYFDTSLNKPIWWIGTKWVDATGVPV